MGNDPDVIGEFNDWPCDCDDGLAGPYGDCEEGDDRGAIELYASALREAVKAFGVEVVEPGEWEWLPGEDLS